MTPIPSSTSVILFVSSTPCRFSISGRNANHQPLYTDYLIPTSALAVSLPVLIHQYLPKPLLCSFLSPLLDCVSLLFAFPTGSLSTELPEHAVSHPFHLLVKPFHTRAALSLPLYSIQLTHNDCTKTLLLETYKHRPSDPPQLLILFKILNF